MIVVGVHNSVRSILVLNLLSGILNLYLCRATITFSTTFERCLHIPPNQLTLLTWNVGEAGGSYSKQANQHTLENIS